MAKGKSHNYQVNESSYHNSIHQIALYIVSWKYSDYTAKELIINP